MDEFPAEPTASGFAAMGDGFWALLEQVCGDDAALLAQCQAQHAANLARAAWFDAHRPPGTLDGKALTPRPRYPDVPVPEEFPGFGPPATWLHDGSELREHGAGYRCPECRDAGFVRREVPVGHPDFGRAHPCRCQVENDATRADRAAVRLRRSGLPDALQRCTFPALQRDLGSEAAIEAVEGWIEAVRTDAARPRLVGVMGEPGRGKTHLCAAALQALAPTADVAWAELPELLADCKADSFALDGPLTQRAEQVPVLVLDRVGGQSDGGWSTEKTERIVMHRYERRKFTLLGLEITARELAAWSPRLASRLSDHDLSVVVTLKGPDRRRGMGAA